METTIIGETASKSSDFRPESELLFELIASISLVLAQAERDRDLNRPKRAPFTVSERTKQENRDRWNVPGYREAMAKAMRRSWRAKHSMLD